MRSVILTVMSAYLSCMQHQILTAAAAARGYEYDVAAVGEANGAAAVPSTFRAAVYEHIPYMRFDSTTVISRASALTIMRRNLEVFKGQTEQAKKQGAKIIVFPEDGLYGFKFTRQSVYPYLEEIPDPEVVQWSPCSDPGRFPDTEVQTALSCMAQENKIYLVANMGDRVPCSRTTDPYCPPDGRYQYNTDVAFGPDGRLLAKYHKANLFYEFQFNIPKPKAVFFDTPFGRVGMLVCFDLLFKEPAVTLVTDHNVTIIAFPTAWMDALPLLSAIGYHSSFARGLGVNFLSANLHLPSLAFQGSGIFTPKGMASFYYDNNPASPGKLLVSSIDVVEDKKELIVSKNNNKNDIQLNATDEFQSKLFDDPFTFKLLEASSGKLSVCQNDVCCSLEYELFPNSSSSGELFAFGVFDGLHTYQGQYYFQICTLVKCANPHDKYSCGSPSTTSTTKFKSFTMTGKFQTDFVYPQVILTNSRELVLADQDAWSFQSNTLQASGPGMDTHPLLSASLFGRFYSRDDGSTSLETASNPNNHGSSSLKDHKPVTVALAVVSVVFVVTVHCLI